MDAVSGESDTGNNCSASVSITVSTTPPAAETWKLYWTDAGTDKIQRSNLDGSDVEDLVITGLDSPRGIALDVAGGKMYWTDEGTDKIQRSNLDGSGVEDLVTSGLDSPFGIALDVAGDRMYWADGGTWERASGAKIQRSNLDGSGVDDLVTSGFTDPFGIALDVSGGKIYWADVFDRIQRSNLDGSGSENLIIGLYSPRGIAVGLVPVVAADSTGGGEPPPPAKAVTGSITDCSATLTDFIYTIRIAGTVRANRTVTNLTLTGYIGGQFVSTVHLGTLSAGQSRSFTISGISGSRPSGECRVSIEWIESGSQSRFILEER